MYTRNSSGDEIANVNFHNDDMRHREFTFAKNCGYGGKQEG